MEEVTHKEWKGYGWQMERRGGRRAFKSGKEQGLALHLGQVLCLVVKIEWTTVGFDCGEAYLNARHRGLCLIQEARGVVFNSGVMELWKN